MTGNYFSIQAVLAVLQGTDLNDPASVHAAIDHFQWISRQMADYDNSWFFREDGWEKGELDPILHLFEQKIIQLRQSEGVNVEKAREMFTACILLASCIKIIIGDNY
jgi:hypothetical protein